MICLVGVGGVCNTDRGGVRTICVALHAYLWVVCKTYRMAVCKACCKCNSLKNIEIWFL